MSVYLQFRSNKPMATRSIIEYFSSIPAPRIERRKKHKLIDIFFITLCGVISGAEGWVGISEYGQTKEAWLTKILGLENGIASHDTLGNVFGMIEIEQFERCFISWVQNLSDLSQGEIISLDGRG